MSTAIGTGRTAAANTQPARRLPPRVLAISTTEARLRRTPPGRDFVSLGLAELALGAALIDRLRTIRWHTVADVLAAGTSPTECAAALGLHSPIALSEQLRAWADTQREQELISDDEHRRILRLAADAAETGQG